jgi:hypothetical protein
LRADIDYARGTANTTYGPSASRFGYIKEINLNARKRLGAGEVVGKRNNY